jgi:2-polyprenyl-3-methyl-5-hydroxy-6-metoxy-1,4-benzoquinol methylase
MPSETTTSQSGGASIKRYLSRVNFFKERLRDKKVLHLGCSAGRYLADRIERNSLIHALIGRVSTELYGIDIDESSLEAMRDKYGFRNLFVGDAEKLDRVEIDKKFDVVLAGDILEHLSCPGAMLEGSKRFLEKNGEIILSTNNAFGLHFQIKRWMGRYKEHVEHVCFFSPETLINLFERHGFRVVEMYGAYTEPPWTLKQKVIFWIGKPILELAPKLSGTLIVVAVGRD